MDKAVVLAAGLGLRMRKSGGSALKPEQEAAANTGIKSMIPIAGKRPFLDYVLSEIAKAGFKKACIVIGPGPEFGYLKGHYEESKPQKLLISYAVQKEPKGTANAILATESFAGDDPFIVVNSDNLYPSRALSKLRKMKACGTIAFEYGALVGSGNITEDRIAKFALLKPDDEFNLKTIIEKPSDFLMKTMKGKIYISMNCWRFGPSIFEACRKIEPSSRGEYEIASAVLYAISKLGETFEMIPVKLPVLDMTRRSDIKQIESVLEGKEVVL